MGQTPTGKLTNYGNSRWKMEFRKVNSEDLVESY